jgi:hypothetical protein
MKRDLSVIGDRLIRAGMNFGDRMARGAPDLAVHGQWTSL